MIISLRVLTGSRAGALERFDGTVVTAGRDPTSDFRFDPQADLDVSTRHAELRLADGVWSIHDRASTNGTYVNDERVSDARALRSGDVVSFGAHGPRVEVQLGGSPRTIQRVSAEPRQDTHVRVAEAVRVETASLRRRFAVALGALVVIGGTGFALWQRRSAAREGELLSLLARSESASVPLQRTITAMQARDSVFARQLAQLDSASARQLAAGRAIATGRTTASGDSVALLSRRVEADARRSESITRMDFARVHDMNDSAVAMVASDLDGTFVAGTAFNIAAGGTLVTNRHVMRSATGRPPRRIRVLFANSTEWLPARLVRVSSEDDLALLQVETPGRYPMVAGISRAASDTRVGSPVATIGYPLAVDVPMEGTGVNVRARTTTTAGTVSKRLADVLQIDSFAGKGSSGSPVLDAAGHVIGVVYGGAAESGGRIVYAVPAERLAAFIREVGAALLR